MADLPGSASVPLDAKETARLTDFARACKAAARAVLLYPPGHPAIAATLGRIVQTTDAASLTGPMKITVLPDGLQMDDRAPARADAALNELAVLLHNHLIGELLQICRYVDANRFGNLHVDPQLDQRGLFHGQIAGIGAVENFLHVIARAGKHLGI